MLKPDFLCKQQICRSCNYANLMLYLYDYLKFITDYYYYYVQICNKKPFFWRCRTYLTVNCEVEYWHQEDFICRANPFSSLSIKAQTHRFRELFVFHVLLWNECKQEGISEWAGNNLDCYLSWCRWILSPISNYYFAVSYPWYVTIHYFISNILGLLDWLLSQHDCYNEWLHGNILFPITNGPDLGFYFAGTRISSPQILCRLAMS